MAEDDASPDLGAYRRWLYRTAAEMLPGNFVDPDLDDLVQEGQIAMWKAYQNYDDCKGTLAPWLTNAARMRMRDLAHGHGRWTGHVPHRGWVDATDRNKRKPMSLNMLMEDPEFDERRLRPSIAKSKYIRKERA